MKKKKRYSNPNSFYKTNLFTFNKILWILVKKLDLSGIHKKNLFLKKHTKSWGNVSFYNCYTVTDIIIKSNQIEYASFTSSKILEVSKYHHPSSSEERSSKIKNLILDNCKISDKNLNQLM
ncbi:hypothetical protein RhiirA5_437899 [Rhizophagus irregularis]|uniref:Uncharacterized protein n=1 Tax=Rhizophagus irregularis TaxID=588596 RepID=A0A2N0NJW7_9GLOM|nr:hypothetical protein RhiirA5_437899 [Rhizophagus irregularis]